MLLEDLTHLRDVRSGRASSWDQTGRNQDFWLIPAGETAVLADLEGPGCIRHIWTTQFCRRVVSPAFDDPALGGLPASALLSPHCFGVDWEVTDPFYYRKVVLKMYWDDQSRPSVAVPFGDFFCAGHCIPGDVDSLAFAVTVVPGQQGRFGASAAFNCYLPMPFNRRARIEVENQNDVPYGLYFHIDYELYRRPQDDIAYFHAAWHRENPCSGWGPEVGVNSPEVDIPNLDGQLNYVLLDAAGRGHYIGCNLSVAHFSGQWWGEGDDMIFVDDEPWPPSLHGTGSEDYLNHAWGMQPSARLLHGSVVHPSQVPGLQVSYRFHIPDPVYFARRIRVTMEHGHANHLADDWASTAYWYQVPAAGVPGLPPVEQRLPDTAFAGTASSGRPAGARSELSEPMRRAHDEVGRRNERLLQERNQRLAQQIANTRQFAQGNAEQARRVRTSFPASES